MYVKPFISILIFLLFAGCTQVNEVDDLVKNREKVIDRAEELGFNSEILLELYEELKKDVINSDVITLLKFHVEGLLEEKKVNESYKNFADYLATEIKEIGPVNETYFEDYKTFKRQTYRINRLSGTVNEKFGTDIPKMGLSREYYDRLRVAKKTMGYIPLIGSYNDLYESSEDLPSNQDEDYWEFYKNLFIFAADFAFIEQKVGYNVAFKSTGELAKAVKLYKSQKVLGSKGYGLLLSEIHWKIRGEIYKGWEDLLDALKQYQLI